MSKFYEKLLRPAMFRLDAESAHEMGIGALRVVLGTAAARRAAETRFEAPEGLAIRRFGLSFKNPVGMAAGFDKNGIVVDQLASLGFGFVEVGTVTLRPQKGNDKPRLFRLADQKALINRLGFNNEGASAVSNRLAHVERKCVVGVNIGKNRDVPTEEATQNYLAAFEAIHPVADYIAVNVSSPNTPGLRDLQNSGNLTGLLQALQKRNGELGARPILLKISPDLEAGEIEAITDACISNSVAGIIATNTTVERNGIPSAESYGPGGLSGSPLRARSIRVISEIYSFSKGKVPIIGVGGIFTASDAFEKIAAGASLVQAYTGFVYCGPAFARNINVGLLHILKERGFSSIDEAVGSSCRP